ncbi:MAG: AAA family ATPase [Bacteroidota bacterium]
MPDLSGLAERLVMLAKEERLSYPADLLRGIAAALLVPRRFVVFYGPPGTGKSRLVQLVADALAAELRLVPVQAGWRDSADLVGFYDAARERFVPGELAAVALRAAAEPRRSFLLCLEEMTLGDPEGYLAGLLCGLDANPPRLHLGLPAGDERGEIPLPENLFYFGTIYAEPGRRVELPRKFLDRAALFELEFADLQPFLAGREVFFPGREPLLAACETMRSHRIPVGYRVCREIAAAVAGAASVGLSPERLLDQQMKARLLPLVRGPAEDVEDCLRALVRLFSAEEVRYPETLDKVVRMLEELGLHGYTAAYIG